MTKTVCVITGSRADYGLLSPLLVLIKLSKELKLQLIVTGSHLSAEFGRTCQDIASEGLTIDRSLEMLLSSDTQVGMVKSMGLGLIGFADAFNELKPDLILLLGDRFEIFAGAIAAATLGIPLAHIHGGEVTQGAIDDSFRHAITKLSNFHFVAAESYRSRVIQMGEPPENVITVGGLGIGSIKDQRRRSRKEIEEKFGITFGAKNLLVTYHSVTHGLSTTAQEVTELLAALSQCKDTTLIFTFPNADANGRLILNLIENYAVNNRNTYVVPSMGSEYYLSCVAECDGVVGNSSSGLLEVPTLKKGTVNIGDRQHGRLTASSVINCKAERNAIHQAIAVLYSTEFKDLLRSVINPYGEGEAHIKIVETIKNLDLSNASKKTFFDLTKL